jgi:phosphatidylglycerol:prolipoprotein diacylglycerol transferase
MDRYAIQNLFGLDIDITWYGVIITSGIIVAFVLGSLIMKRKGFRDEIVFEALLVVVPLAILGARLWYVLFQQGASITDFFNFQDGGLAIHGAIAFGALGLFIYTKFIRKCSFFAVCDIVVVVLILAQSIGRWGNFFNQEIFGLSTGDFHFFPLTVWISRPDLGIAEGPYLALFFYESILNLIGFVFLFLLFRKQKKYGITSAAYFIFYGAVRLALEPLRMSSFIMTGAGFPISIVTSVGAIILGMVLLVLNKRGMISQKDITLRPRQDKKEEVKKKKA